jgi:tetratricopeptide (TPR) repeat protein
LGERANKREYFENAIAACRSALKELTRQRVPLLWAMVWYNMGRVFWAMEERESGKRHLEGGIAAYQNALKEYILTRVPSKFAATQNNLGTAFGVLGGIEQGTRGLKKAVICLTRMPQGVSARMGALELGAGAALIALGEQERRSFAWIRQRRRWSRFETSYEKLTPVQSTSGSKFVLGRSTTKSLVQA